VGSAIERRFLIVAGEASADAHAARMIQNLEQLGTTRVRGVTGPALAAAGAERVVDMNELAVIGFSGVVARLPRILTAYRRLLAESETFRPDAAVLVDSPGFNFRLGPALKKRGVRVFYYIAPQVWAWHPERAHAMSRWVDRLAVVFPFEEPLFREAGVAVRFVGHPLLDALETERDEAGFRAELGVAPQDRVLGLLPGSRRQEIRHHLPAMLETARRLSQTRPDLATVVPLAPGLALDELAAAGVEGVAGGSGPVLGARAAGLPRLKVVAGRTRAVQAFATACAVASGTATLECALFGTPLVIVYRTGALNYALARRLVRLPRIGLPNVISGEEVAPELLQGDLTAPRLAGLLEPLLDDPASRDRARARLRGVREKLGAPGASRRTAELLWEMVA
jgi:lipid-A-disaccharide synthase